MNETKPITPSDLPYAAMIGLNSIQKAAHQINRQNGWWDGREKLLASAPPELAHEAMVIQVISLLGLVTSEVAEAMEAARKHPVESWGDETTKDTLVRELAGTVVRCMDLAEWLGAPLGDAIIEELRANIGRGYKHGGKAA